MNYPRYDYSAENELNIFEFDSIGNKGKITKIVQYTEMSVKGYYNLSFGDLNIVTGNLNDGVITNNCDAIKILSTVVSTLYAFTGKYPEVHVFATRSSEARTRLYRMGITNNLAEISEDFKVFGLNSNGEWDKFIVGEDYEAFLLTKKENIL